MLKKVNFAKHSIIMMKKSNAKSNEIFITVFILNWKTKHSTSFFTSDQYFRFQMCQPRKLDYYFANQRTQNYSPDCTCNKKLSWPCLM